MTKDEELEMLENKAAELREPKPTKLPHVDEVLFGPLWSPKGAWYCSADYGTGDIPAWFSAPTARHIRYAWKLIEEVNSTDVCIEKAGERWYCYFTYGVGDGETAAEAICRAFVANRNVAGQP